MSKYTIQLHDNGRCKISHELADAEIITDLPPEYGGNGQSFSSTDLVSAALGSCTLTALDKILEREGFDSKKIKILVTKTLSQSPKMIEKIKLEIYFPDELSDVLLKKLENATKSCPVKRSLNEQIQIETVFKTDANLR
ncbi:MAG: OsmC family protein [Desulfobacterales bacterium]|nr:OsmC family protein [Desulfobacterales bacterium]